MKKIHYSWIICVVCTLLLFCTVGLASSAFSVYQPYIISENGFSNTQASAVLTVRSIASVLSMLVVDKIIKRLNLRVCAVVSLIGEAIGFGLYATSKTLIGYCVSAAIVGVVHSTGGMVLVSIIIAKWFHSRRGTALSICAAGSGLAAIVSPPLITAMIEATSLRTAFGIEAGFMIVCALLMVLVLRNAPEEKGMHAFSTGKAEAVKSRTYGKGISRTAFLWACLAMFLLGAVTNMDTAHISTLYKASGFDSVTVSFLLSLSGATLVVGKFIYGPVSDKCGDYRASYFFLSMLLIGQVLHTMAGLQSSVLAFVAMIFMGLGLPVSTVGISMTAANLSTEEAYPKTLKTLQTIYLTGSLCFSLIPGILADLTGSYNLAAYITVGMVAVHYIIIQSVKKSTRTD